MGQVAAKGKNFAFAGTVWLWNGDSPWHFASIPEGITDEIEDPGTFLLPLKKQVRQQLGCEAGARVRLSLRILDD